MKIVYCIPALYNSAGMERVLTRKANYFAEKLGYEIIIVTTCQKGRDIFYKLADNIKYIDLDIDYETIATMPIHKKIIARKKAAHMHRMKLERVLKEIKPDITISMYTHEMKFLPEIKDGSKKLLELHFSKNFRSLDAKANHKSALSRVIGNILDNVERRCIKNYDKFIVLSNRDATDWGSKYKNIEVICNPSSFEPSYIANPSLKKVLAIGRICQQKGFDMLIDAWHTIDPEIRNGWTLDIVGSGPDKQALYDKIGVLNLNDSIKLKEPVKDVKSLYESHSIFCFPSRYEGFPLALMEAMSFGLCPIAFDCPCGPSELIADNETGALISPDNVDEFSRQLSVYMQNQEKRRNAGIKAYQHIMDNFTESIIMSKWENVFLEM